MGVMFGSGHLRRRSKSGRNYRPMSEINVTPFVDVMLVLLIIFMVTAPLLTVGVPIDLPQTKARQLEGDKEPLTISVASTGKLFLQETEIPLNEIVPKLVAITKRGYDERIFVRGDRATNYGTVIKVMGTIAAAGFTRIALVTE
ncbi:MAG: protein TolR, partial [Methyloligellaceae bacterium]